MQNEKISILKKIKNKIISFEENKTIKNFKLPFLISLFLLGFVGLSLIALIVQILLEAPINGTFLNSEFLNTLNEEEIKNSIINFFNSVSLFMYYFITFFIFIILIIVNKESLSYIKSCIHKNAFIEGIAIAIMMFCCSIAYSMFIQMINPSTTSNNNQQGIENAFYAAPLLSFFSIVLFAPVCEELTYRLGLFSLIAKKSKILAYIVTILFFTLIHFDFSVKTPKEWTIELINMPAYMIGAIFLCFAYARKGNILTSITAHACYNGIEFLLMLINL